MNESKQITLKHNLLNAAWSFRDKGYDNEYAVAYQAVREVFDAEVLPYIETLKKVADDYRGLIRVCRHYSLHATYKDAMETLEYLENVLGKNEETL